MARNHFGIIWRTYGVNFMLVSSTEVFPQICSLSSSAINAYGLVSLSMRQNTETLPTFLWHCLGLDVNIIKNIRT